MHHWFGDQMSLKAEKQIKVSGMSMEKCGEFAARCGEGYFESSHLELTSITLISLSRARTRMHTFSLSLARFLFLSLWPAVTGGFSFHFRGARCISQSWPEPVCVSVSGRIPLLDTCWAQVQPPWRLPVQGSMFSSGASSPPCPALLLAPMKLTEDKTSIPGR